MPITPPDNSVVGQIWSWMNIDCGPTIGWVRRPMFNDKYITTGSSYSIQPFDWRLLLNLPAPATFTFNLPLVNTWMKQPWGQFPLQFKDVAMNVGSATPIVIARAGTDLIDGLTSVSIISPGGSATIAPKSDLSGWSLLP